MLSRRAKSSILHVTGERQVSLSGGAEAVRLIGRSLATSHVPLSSVVDEDRLLQGHVFLGFSHHGYFVISYRCQVMADASFNTTYHYSLHWWQFEMHKPLKHMVAKDLFCGQDISDELFLLVCEHKAEQTVVIVGCQKGGNYTDQRTSYITVCSAPSPPPYTKLHSNISIHFSHELLPPFPAFNAFFALCIPGCVLINTGCSLVLVCYDSEVNDSIEKPPSSSSCSISTIRQYFSSDGDSQSDINMCSPSHALPLMACSADQPLNEHSYKPTTDLDCVCITQFILDVEDWLNEYLSKELSHRELQFHSLNDYDIQLVGVNAEEWEVLFVVVVVIEASEHSLRLSLPPDNMSCIHLYGSWNIKSGAVEIIHSSALLPPPPHPCGGKRVPWNPAPSLAIQLCKKAYLPRSSLCPVTVFSNHTVFSGKSLLALRHPFLPYTLVLQRSPRI